MTKQEMLNKMCLIELAQADAKAIGRCRVFDVEVVESRALLQHVFLSEQGVRGALASLTEMEILGLHLLNHRREAVGLEFFKRVYPGSVPANLYASHTVRFKGLLQTIKANLIRRGILLFCTLTQGFEEKSVSERLRFCFPEEFGSFLPAPFPSHRLAAAASRQYRKEVLQDKLAEILRPERAPGKEPATQDEARWLLANGELRFGGKPFSVERIKAWPLTQLTAAFPARQKSGRRVPARPIAHLRLSRLGKTNGCARRPVAALETGIAGRQNAGAAKCLRSRLPCGLLEKAEQDGTGYFRWRGLVEARPMRLRSNSWRSKIHGNQD